MCSPSSPYSGTNVLINHTVTPIAFDTPLMVPQLGFKVHEASLFLAEKR